MLKTLTIAAVAAIALAAIAPAYADGPGGTGGVNGVSLNGIAAPSAAIAGGAQMPAIELPATH